MANILTIDPGTRLGYSVWTPEHPDKPIEFGALTAPGKLPTNERATYLENMMDMMFESVMPDVVVIEDVIKGNYKSWQARYWLGVTYRQAERLAESYGATLHAVPIQSLKVFATGKGNAKKIDMVNAINRRLGMSLSKNKDDECDALWLGLYYLEKLRHA